MYARNKYWKNEFIKEGRTITWEEAMAEFHDATDRPGPSIWEVGDYPAATGAPLLNLIENDLPSGRGEPPE